MARNQSGGLRKIIFGLFLVAFCGFAIFTDIVVRDLNKTADSAVLVSRDGTPANWSFTGSDKFMELSFEGEAMADSTVQYTSSVRNLTDSTIKITHIASYLETADYSGFVDFGDATIEYSYEPEKSDSWQKVAISEPANSMDGFKLETPVKVAPKSEAAGQVYFRYRVSAKGSDEISDNFVVLATDRGGTAVKAERVITVATNTSSETVATTNGDGSDTEKSYAKPLGVTSASDDAEVIDSVVNTAGTIVTPLTLNSLAILFGIAGVFAISFIAYLALGKRKNN